MFREFKIALGTLKVSLNMKLITAQTLKLKPSLLKDDFINKPKVSQSVYLTLCFTLAALDEILYIYLKTFQVKSAKTY